MYRLLYVIFCVLPFGLLAQPPAYSAINAHSHNDYEKEFPFWMAWKQGFGSIEADIFLDKGELVVAHDTAQLKRRWLFDSLYLQPLAKCVSSNNGTVYADRNSVLQLLIDLKTPADPLLDKLVDKLRSYPSLINNPSLRIVITGNRPAPALFGSYPAWIFFDGELKATYTDKELERIVMLSDNFASYSSWNGKNKIPAAEYLALKNAISKAHSLNKKVRFWNAPDILNSWYGFMSMGVDFINTDQIIPLGTFLRQLPERTYTSTNNYSLYKPAYRNDGLDKPVKNIIVLIGDGTGLPQWYAGYTANKGALNVFNMHYTGLSKTSSYNNYITDSAPGATAISSGVKTNNRAVGVDHTGKPLVLLPGLLRERKMKTGVITSGDITDATPAAFYAHQSERSHSEDMLHDLLQAPVDLLMGKGTNRSSDSLKNKLAARFNWVNSVDKVQQGWSKPWLVTEETAGLSMLEGRGDWAQRAFAKALSLLSGNRDGFFLMLEGAQIDHGAHDNQLPFLVTEVMDFDKVVGKAMEFADSNGETLIIVTADHETGGLTLTGGDYSKGYIAGQFSTEDHTASPVPVFAYGPQAHLFTGVYENTEIFSKILFALKMKQ
jgi:alkaline phosphatase